MISSEQEIRCRALDLALSAGITFINNGGSGELSDIVGSALAGARHFAEYIEYGTTLAAPGPGADLGSESDTH